MSKTSQRRTVDNYRSRLTERGMARFEVVGRESDRELIRSFAKRLAEDGPEVVRLRETVARGIAGEAPRKGGIVAALLRSPLVGSNIDLSRARVDERKVDL